MSKRIQYLVEVIEEVVDERSKPGRSRQDISELRIGAVHTVAERHGVNPNTVADAFIQQLRPEIGSTAEFDDLLADFVQGTSDELIGAMTQNIVDDQDIKRIIGLLNDMR